MVIKYVLELRTKSKNTAGKPTIKNSSKNWGQIPEYALCITQSYPSFRNLFIISLKIAPTRKVKIQYEEEWLLTISKVDDSKDVAPPPFKIMHIRIGDDSENDEIIFKVRLENGTSVVFDGLSYESFISCIKENGPDIAIIYEEYQYDNDIASSIGNLITEYCNRTVVIRSRDTVDDISLIELVERARFSYLPLKLASRYGMIRLIDSRITYELLKENL